MTMIVGRQPVMTIPLPVRYHESAPDRIVTESRIDERGNVVHIRYHESALDRFATLLVLRLMQYTQCDVRSRKPSRVTDGLRFLYSEHAQSLAAGIGIDIEWLRSAALSDHYFIELPDLDTGRRFRSSMQPVVVRGSIQLLPGSQFYKILASEPAQFAADHPAFTSADWVEVAEGPARWLSDDEYIKLLKNAKVDRRLVAAARRQEKEAR